MTQTIAQPTEVIAPVQTPDTLVVTVLPRHIENGYRNHPNFCAVARALTDDGWSVALVDADSVDVYSDHLSIRFRPSPELIDWIHRFDAGEPVEPERFVLHALR